MFVRRLHLPIISLPKTIDNDLPATDHCPGYGSTGRSLLGDPLPDYARLEEISVKPEETP